MAYSGERTAESEKLKTIMQNPKETTDSHGFARIKKAIVNFKGHRGHPASLKLRRAGRGNNW